MRKLGSDQNYLAISPRGDLVFKAQWDNASVGFPGREALFMAGFPGSAPVIPVEGQPAAVRGETGGSAQFQVTANGSSPVTFQWKFNGTGIPHATDPTLTLENVNAANRGLYTAVVTNALGSMESQSAALTFPPLITQQPRDQTVATGANVSFITLATGGGTLSWQWEFQATGALVPSDIPGATSPGLTLGPAAAARAGRYSARVSNADGTTAGEQATLTVAPAGRPVFTKMVLTGERTTIPGAPFYHGLPLGVLNNHGGVLFQTGLADAAGIGLGIVIMGGAPKAFEHYLNSLAQPNLSNSSRAAFHGGSLTVMTGTAGALATFYGGYSDRSPLINDSGVIAFRREGGIWTGSAGALQSVAQTGNAAPDAGAGVTFSAMGEPVLNAQAKVAFWGKLTGPQITAANDEGIWFGPTSAPLRVVAEAAPAPGLAAGVIFAGFPTVEPSLNSAGRIVFHAALSGTGITASNNEGIWAGVPGSLALVVQRGAVASGQTFSGLTAFTLPTPRINAAGQVLFYANCTATGGGGSRQTIWLWTPGAGTGTLRMIAREGDQAPGMPAGVVFDSVANGQPYFFGAINAVGQIAFFSYLSGPGVDAELPNDSGLWMTNSTGAAEFLVRTGDSFDVGGGEMRTVSNSVSAILGSGGQDGHPRALSDRGELLFSARFGLGAANTNGLFTARFSGSIPGLAYTIWRDSYNLTGPEAGEQGDFDHDGLTNFFEYVHGSDPTVGGSSPQSYGTASIDGRDWLTQSYRRYDDRIAEGVTYIPEGSSGLGGWGTAGIIEEVDPDAPVIPGSTACRCRVPIGGAIRFLRVKAVKL